MSDSNAISDCLAYVIEVPSSSTFSDTVSVASSGSPIEECVTVSSTVCSWSSFDASVVVIPLSPTISEITRTDDVDDDDDD